MSDSTETFELPTQITIVLPAVITFDNREYSQLVMREPTAGDILLGEEQVKNGANAWTLRNRQVHLIAKCSGVPLPVVTRLPMRAFNTAWNFIVPFYEATLETPGS